MWVLSVAVTQAAGAVDQQLQNRLRAHIEFLADDLLRGRQPGRDGYNIAANYVASQFLQMGLSPAGTGGGYFQQVMPDPFPEQNIFVRSDHYRFVQQGIPSIFLVTGIKSLDGRENTQAIFENFLAKQYHRPGDDLSLPIHYGAAARFTRINARIGEKLANERNRPGWNEGDFFGRTFAK